MQHPDTLLFQHAFVREQGSFPATFCLTRRAPETLARERHTFLSPAEEAEWREFKFAARRDSHLLGRYCAKKAAAAHRGLASMPAIEIRSGVFQHPVLHGPGTDALQISIAHSGTLAAAVAFDQEHPMGIDVEALDAERLAVIQSHLTSPESLMLPRDAAQRTVALGLVWTAKEALAKAIRTGLMTPLQVLEIAHPAWSDHTLQCEFTSFAQYRAVSFRAGDHVLGLAFPRRSTPEGTLAALRERFAFPD